MLGFRTCSRPLLLKCRSAAGGDWRQLLTSGLLAARRWTRSPSVTHRRLVLCLIHINTLFAYTVHLLFVETTRLIYLLCRSLWLLGRGRGVTAVRAARLPGDLAAASEWGRR